MYVHRTRILLAACVILMAQLAVAQRVITGTITDAEYGEALIGANVFVKGATIGTVTDFDGNFSMEIPDSASTLVFSYTGYQAQEVPIGAQSQYDIKLVSGQLLDEVVVVGYGTQKKREVTGAISQVKASDLEDMPVMRIEQSLQGRVSGVRVTQNSGQPGEGSTVRVRGTTSINGSEPLYVVDGVPIGGGIDYLNQGDIESIEVLKDAASASIYGARSANGVILVTTKKGAEDQMKVTYSGYYGVQSPWKKMSLLDAEEYGILMNESSVAAGGELLFDPDTLGTGTDWQDAVFNLNAPIQNHELSISAGSKASKYFASFGYFDQEGIVAPEDSRYQRFTMRFNSTHEIAKGVRVGNTLGYTRTRSSGVSTNSEFGSPLSRAINLDPLTPVLETRQDVLNSPVFQNFPVVTNGQGVPYGISELVTSEVLNPVAALEVQQGYGWSDKLVGNVFLEFDFLKDFTFNTNFGADIAFWGGEGFTPIHYLNATNRADLTNYNRSQNRGLYWIWQNTLKYNKTFGDHTIGGLAGIVSERNRGRGQGGNLQDIPVDNLDDASLAFATPAETQTFYGFEYESTLVSYLGRLQYNFRSKYLFSVSLRADGSSRFGSNNRFGYFPSVSAGWVVSDENFFNSNFLNFMKIRGSWGVNGSDQIGDFRFVSTVGGGRNYTLGLDDRLVNGVSPNAIANPDLRWEQTTQLNFGIDAKVARYVSVTLDYFDKRTTDMLLDIAVPGYVGNAGPVGNIATLSNQGVELELGYSRSFGEFNLDVSGNVTWIQNEITDLGPDKEFLVGQTFSPQGLEITRTSVGLPIGYLFGYKTDGIFQNQDDVDSHTDNEGNPLQPDAAPGDFRFVDVNGDGILDADDRTMIGDPTPTWTYGFTANLSWKGFDLLIFGQGVGGNDVFKATRRFDLQMANMTADALGRWTGEGTTNSYPRLISNDPNKNFSRSSDFYVESGAFFRIKTMQIGYNLPERAITKMRMSNLRFYVTANNLLTFTKYTGFDPEIGGGSFGVDRGFYPQARSFMFGVNASF